MILLGVNIDHIATLRNARGENYPNLVTAAGVVENSGADFITMHLREDRRHINEKDLYLLAQTVNTYINLEMACNEDVLHHALKVKPYKATLVPERREEVTTEGGLNVKDNFSRIKEYTDALKKAGIKVSLFIEGDLSQLDLFLKTGADEIEIHTGTYSLAPLSGQSAILEKIKMFSEKALASGLKVCAGHGLNYHNVKPLAMIKQIEELNIGHAIISYSVYYGLEKAVSDMRSLICEAELNRK